MITEPNSGESKTINDRIQSGELRFWGNMPNLGNVALSTEQAQRHYQALDNLRRKYGEDGVVLTAEVVDKDGSKPDPGMTGIYVDAHKFSELHPDQ